MTGDWSRLTGFTGGWRREISTTTRPLESGVRRQWGLEPCDDTIRMSFHVVAPVSALFVVDQI